MLQFFLIATTAAVVIASPFPKVKETLALKQDQQIVGDGSLNRNNPSTQIENDLSDEYLDQQLKIDKISYKLPFTGYTVMFDGTKMANGEFDVKLNFSSGDQVEARKKSKIKKVFIPLLVLILLKAIVLIPLALGVLGIKTWNAIQLSFISFVSSIVLAIWKLCSKISHDHPPTVIHSAWDPHHHHDRSDVGQMVPYSSYAPS